MLKPIVAGLVMAAALTVADGPAAYAAGCLSEAQARQAIQSGQAVSLGRFAGAISAATGGGRINGYPQLCNAGGRLVWIVQVLTGSGRQVTITVDARTGAIH